METNGKNALEPLTTADEDEDQEDAASYHSCVPGYPLQVHYMKPVPALSAAPRLSDPFVPEPASLALSYNVAGSVTGASLSLGASQLFGLTGDRIIFKVHKPPCPHVSM